MVISKLTSAFSILLTLLNCFTVLIITWACFRGFDLSDESYYYLGYHYFDNTPNLGPATFHLVFGRFFSSLQLTLSEIRILRLVLTFLATTILYIGVEAINPKKNSTEKIILFNVVLSGMLLSYTWGPLALSYNSMSSILISSIIGFWLLGLATDKTYSKASFSAIIGAMFALLFFVKITNIFLLPLILIATLLWRHKRKSKKQFSINPVIGYTIAFIIGAIVGLTFLSKGISSILQEIGRHVHESFGMMNNDSSHSVQYLWNRYYDNSEMVFKRLKYPVLVLSVFFLGIKIYSLKTKIEYSRIVQRLFKMIGILILIIIIYQNKYWKGGTGSVYIILTPYIFIAVFVLLNKYLENKKVDLTLLFCLLLIPIMGAVGTNNGLSAQVLFYGSFIVLAIYYLLDSYQTHWYRLAVLGSAIALGASQITSGTVFHPYRQAQLTESKFILDDVSNLEHLKVTKDIFDLRGQLAFLDQVEAEYVFAYSPQGGITLLANKKPYSLDWFEENMVQKTCLIINNSEIEPKNIIFIIPSKKHMAEEVIGCLKKKGIFFKTDYSKIKVVEFFDPNSKKVVMADIYIPRQFTNGDLRIN